MTYSTRTTYKTNHHDIISVWNTITRSDSNFAHRLHNQVWNAHDHLVNDAITAHAPHLKVIKGQGKGNPQQQQQHRTTTNTNTNAQPEGTFPKGKGKGKGKGKNEHFADIPLPPDLFRHPTTNAPLEPLDAHDFTGGEDCIVQCNVNTLLTFIDNFYYQSPQQVAAVVITAAAEWDDLIANYPELLKRFSPTKLSAVPTARGNAPGGRSVDVAMFQFGTKHGVFCDPTETHVINQNDTHSLTKMIVEVRARHTPTGAFDKLPTDINSYILSAYGAQNLAAKKLNSTPPKEITWAGQPDRSIRSIVFVKTATKHLTLHRSGTASTYMYPYDNDPRLDVLPLPRDLSHADALALNRQIGAKALGVTTTLWGFGIRCVVEDIPYLRSIIYAADVLLYGPELFALNQTNATQYVIRGIDDTVHAHELHNVLKQKLQWAVLPLKQLHGADRSTKDWTLLVPKNSPPPSCTYPRLITTSGLIMQTAIDELPFTNRSTVWSRCWAKITKHDDDNADDEDDGRNVTDDPTTTTT